MKAVVVGALLLLSFAALPHSSAQVTSTSFSLQIYADGSASLMQSLSVNSSDVSITVPLISPIITNVLATDQNGSPLSFQISEGNITVYTIGSTEANIQYDTDSLTSKQGSVWRLSFSTDYNLTVILPVKSSLSYVTGTPTSLSEQNGSPLVVVSPGNWSISYGVSLEAGSSSSQTTVASNSSRTSSTTLSSSTSPHNLPLSDAAIIGAVLIAGSLGGFYFLRGRKKEIQSTELRPDDVQVLNYISEKGGKVFEQEIRSRFTLPKTSAWRQLKRLERLGYLKIYKVGSQNQVEMLKKREST